MFNGVLRTSQRGKVDIRQFIRDEMERRDYSMRQFAELIDVDVSRVSRFMNQPDMKPTIDFLLHLSRGTNVSLGTLVELAYGESVSARPRTSTLLLAEKIDNLPESLRQAIEIILRSHIN